MDLTPPVVALSWAEILLAAAVGAMRRVKSLKRGDPPKYGATKESAWDHDINGALAEMGTAKWAGAYWTGMGTIGRVDVADVGILQVRSKLEFDHRLVLHLDEKADEIFVSVFVDPPRCILCGWTVAGDGMKDEWLFEAPGRPPMYWVRNKFLRPMDELHTKERKWHSIEGGKANGPR
jgi:hypothetical protein